MAEGTEVFNIHGTLTLDSAPYSAGLKGASAETETAASRMGSAGRSADDLSSRMGGVGRSMTSVGKSLSMGLSLPLLAVGVASIKMATDFQTQMEMVHTQAGASQQEVDSLSKSVLAMGGTVEQGPEELAKGLFHIESAGFRGADAMNVLKIASEGAAVGNTDLDSTATVLVSLLNAHVQGANNAADAMGNLNAIVGAGNMRMDDLNQAMSTGVMATAGAFGVSIQSVGAALADLTRQGVPAVDAATHLRMMMTLMVSPTSAASKALQEVGVGADEAAQKSASMAGILQRAGVNTSQLADDMRKPNGLQVALQDLKDHLEKAGIGGQEAAGMIEKAFGGVKSGTTAIELSQDMGGLSQAYDLVSQHASHFQDDVKAQQKTAGAAFKELKSAGETALVSIGSAILPPLVSILKVLNPVLVAVSHAFQTMPGPVKAIIVGLGVFLALLGPILVVAGMFVSALAVIGPIIATVAGFLAAALIPILLVVAAIVLVVIAVHKHWHEIMKALHPLFKLLGEAVHSVVQAMEKLWNAIKPALPALEQIGKIILAVVAVAFVIVVGAIILFLVVLAKVITIVIQVATVIVGFLIGAFKVVITVLTFLGGLVSAVVMGWWHVISPVVTMIWNLIVTAFNIVKSIVTTVVTAIWSVISTVFSAIWSVISSVVSSIWGFIVSVWSAIYGFIAGIVQSIWGAVSGAFNNMVGAVAGAVSGIYNAIVSVFDSVWGFISGFAGRVFSAGVAIVQAIANGISSAAGAIWDAIKGALGAAFDVVAKALGWHSPATVYIPAGKAIMEGMAVGILSGGAVLDSALNNVLPPGIGSTGSLTGTPGTAGALSGGGVTKIEQNFYPQRMSRADMDMAMAEGRYSVGMKLKGGS